MKKLSIVLLLLSSVVVVGTANAAVQSGVTAGSGAISRAQKAAMVTVDLNIVRAGVLDRVLALEIQQGVDFKAVKKAVTLALAKNKIDASEFKLFDSNGAPLSNDSLRNIFAMNTKAAMGAKPTITVSLPQ